MIYVHYRKTDAPQDIVQNNPTYETKTVASENPLYGSSNIPPPWIHNLRWILYLKTLPLEIEFIDKSPTNKLYNVFKLLHLCCESFSLWLEKTIVADQKDMY